MKALTKFNSIRNKASRFVNDERTKKALRIAKDNWFEVAVVAGVALIAQDADTTAEYAQATFTVELLEAISEGVI